MVVSRSRRTHISSLMIASVVASSALSPLVRADINTSTDLTATLSNTNFVQTDADALQDRLDAITAEIATLQQDLTETSTSSSNYTTLVTQLAQLNATSIALQAIILKLREGAEITRYDVATSANGTATVVVTYDDGTTTTATIPAAATESDDESDDSSNDDSEEDDGESGGSSGSGGSASDMLSSILGQLLSGGGANGNLGDMLGGVTGNPTGATTGNPATQPSQPTPQTPTDKTEEKEEKQDCKPRATTATSPGKAADDSVSANGSTTTQQSGTTETEVGKAADDDISSNGSTEAYNKEQEDKQKALDKLPYCEAPDVDTPNPEEEGGVAPDKIKSLADAQAAVGKYWCDPSNSNCTTNKQQCASLTKAFAPEVGRASTWQKGSLVKGNNDLAIGTPIATFNYGNSYCQVTSGGGCGVPGGGVTHTGIYLGQNAQGIQILDQYSGQKAQIRTIPWSGNRISGNMYYTIKGANAWLETIPLLQPVQMALHITPWDAGLLQISSQNIYF